MGTYLGSSMTWRPRLESWSSMLGMTVSVHVVCFRKRFPFLACSNCHKLEMFAADGQLVASVLALGKKGFPVQHQATHGICK